MERRPASDRPSPARGGGWILDPRRSLRARAALLFGGSAAAFAALVGWLAGLFLQRALETQLGAHFETLAHQVSDKLDRTLYERYRELQLAATLAPFRQGDTAPAERRQLLEAMQNSARDFAWIGFADPAGKVQVATEGLFESTAADTRPWFLLGRERPYAGALKDAPALARELAPGEERPLKFLDLAVPVRGDAGQFLGVLGAHVQWDWAREVQLSVVPETARRDRIGVAVYAPNGELLLDSGGTGWSLAPEAPAIPGPRRLRGAFLERTTEGATFLTGYARSAGYREFRGLNWLVAVRQPVAHALAPVRHLRRVIVGWGLAFTGVIATVSWIAAGRLARRMQSVGAAAERIRQGDILAVMPLPHGQGEWARMCAALGDMVTDLRGKSPAADTATRNGNAAAPGRDSSLRSE